MASKCPESETEHINPAAKQLQREVEIKEINSSSHRNKVR